MRATLSRLCAEHDHIERAAEALLAVLDDAAAPELARRLLVLADIVYDHLAEEDALAQRLDAVLGDGPEAQRWRAGLAAFLRLRDDWLTFLHRWREADIAADRAGFAATARAVLTHLRARIELETDAFHAAAIRHGLVAAH